MSTTLRAKAADEKYGLSSLCCASILKSITFLASAMEILEHGQNIRSVFIDANAKHVVQLDRNAITLEYKCIEIVEIVFFCIALFC